MNETKDRMVVGVTLSSKELRESRAQRVAWGLVLMAAGVVFLCQQLGMVDLPPLWHWWPAALYAIALPRFFSPKGWPEGITLILLGSWFFAVNADWHGLTYANSWPIVLVAFGLEIVLKTMIERAAVRPQEGPHA